jgi:hypothetical protein
MICASDGMLSRVSTLIRGTPAPTCWALVIWAAVRPFGTVMSQPSVWIELCRRSVVIACSVITVFGGQAGPHREDVGVGVDRQRRQRPMA